MSKSPDKFENSLRFGCGGIFGAGLGMIASMRILPLSSSAFTILTCIILFVVVSGLLAVRFGLGGLASVYTLMGTVTPRITIPPRKKSYLFTNDLDVKTSFERPATSTIWFKSMWRVAPADSTTPAEIGRASCRERVSPYV